MGRLSLPKPRLPLKWQLQSRLQLKRLQKKVTGTAAVKQTKRGVWSVGAQAEGAFVPRDGNDDQVDTVLKSLKKAIEGRGLQDFPSPSTSRRAKNKKTRKKDTKASVSMSHVGQLNRNSNPPSLAVQPGELDEKHNQEGPHLARARVDCTAFSFLNVTT